MTTSKTFFTGLALLLILGLAGCGGESPQRVYVAGYVNDDEGNNVATLWIDGEPQTIAVNAQASSVFVAKNNIIYVAGSTREEYDFTATLWKIQGDKISQITLDKAGTYANSVSATDGGEVYVSGHEYGDNDEGVYWKVSGTKVTRIPLDTMQENMEATARAICVAPNGDVYVAGKVSYLEMGGDWFAVIWKNGEGQYLSDGKYAEADAIYIAGNGDVHVAGQKTLSHRVAVVWKNNVLQYLSKGPMESMAYAIFATPDGDVYAAGYERDRNQLKDLGIVWKNGTKQIITDNGAASSIYVSHEDDVYVAGRQITDPSRAMLWKNATAQPLANEGSTANSVFVK